MGNQVQGRARSQRPVVLHRLEHVDHQEPNAPMFRPAVSRVGAWDVSARVDQQVQAPPRRVPVEEQEQTCARMPGTSLADRYEMGL